MHFFLAVTSIVTVEQKEEKRRLSEAGDIDGVHLVADEARNADSDVDGENHELAHLKHGERLY